MLPPIEYPGILAPAAKDININSQIMDTYINSILAGQWLVVCARPWLPSCTLPVSFFPSCTLHAPLFPFCTLTSFLHPGSLPDFLPAPCGHNKGYLGLQ